MMVALAEGLELGTLLGAYVNLGVLMNYIIYCTTQIHKYIASDR